MLLKIKFARQVSCEYLYQVSSRYTIQSRDISHEQTELCNFVNSPKRDPLHKVTICITYHLWSDCIT